MTLKEFFLGLAEEIASYISIPVTFDLVRDYVYRQIMFHDQIKLDFRESIDRSLLPLPLSDRALEGKVLLETIIIKIKTEKNIRNNFPQNPDSALIFFACFVVAISHYFDKPRSYIKKQILWRNDAPGFVHWRYVETSKIERKLDAMNTLDFYSDCFGEVSYFSPVMMGVSLRTTNMMRAAVDAINLWGNAKGSASAVLKSVADIVCDKDNYRPNVNSWAWSGSDCKKLQAFIRGLSQVFDHHAHRFVSLLIEVEAAKDQALLLLMQDKVKALGASTAQLIAKNAPYFLMNLADSFTQQQALKKGFSMPWPLMTSFVKEIHHLSAVISGLKVEAKDRLAESEIQLLTVLETWLESFAGELSAFFQKHQRDHIKVLYEQAVPLIERKKVVFNEKIYPLILSRKDLDLTHTDSLLTASSLLCQVVSKHIPALIKALESDFKTHPFTDCLLPPEEKRVVLQKTLTERPYELASLSTKNIEVIVPQLRQALTALNNMLKYLNLLNQHPLFTQLLSVTESAELGSILSELEKFGLPYLLWELSKPENAILSLLSGKFDSELNDLVLSCIPVKNSLLDLPKNSDGLLEAVKQQFTRVESCYYGSELFISGMLPLLTTEINAVLKQCQAPKERYFTVPDQLNQKKVSCLVRLFFHVVAQLGRGLNSDTLMLSLLSAQCILLLLYIVPSACLGFASDDQDCMASANLFNPALLVLPIVAHYARDFKSHADTYRLNDRLTVSSLSTLASLTATSVPSLGSSVGLS